GLLIHFEQNEILEATLVQSPGGAETCNAPANNHDSTLLLPDAGREGAAITKFVPQLERIVDKASPDRTIAFDRKPDQRCAAGFEKLPARNSQWLMSFQS